MRNKEDASDYRYFPEPDLLPVEVSQEKIDLIKSTLPELPEQKKQRCIEKLSVNEYDAEASIIEEQDLKQITDKGQISEVINKIIETHQDKVQEYKSGKTRLYGFFVGEIMKLTKGKANPDIANSILNEKLSS